MAGEVSIPGSVLVVKAVVRKLTRFVVEYAALDATTKFTVEDQDPDQSKRYRFKTLAAVPIAGMANKLLVTVRTTRLPLQGRTFPTANLRLLAETATQPDGAIDVAAVMLHKQYPVVEMARLVRQTLRLAANTSTTLTLPVRGTRNYVTARVSATHGTWEVVTATQSAADLTLALRCLTPTFRLAIDAADAAADADAAKAKTGKDQPLVDVTGSVTVTMTSEDDEEEELPPAEVVFV